MTDLIVGLLSWFFLLGGAFFLLVGAIGVLRFPDFYTRLHAVSVCGTMGTGMIIAGLMLQGGLSLVSMKLLLIFYFMIFTGPAATHALAGAALQGNLKPVIEEHQT